MNKICGFSEPDFAWKESEKFTAEMIFGMNFEAWNIPPVEEKEML